MHYTRLFLVFLFLFFSFEGFSAVPKKKQNLFRLKPKKYEKIKQDINKKNKNIQCAYLKIQLEKDTIALSYEDSLCFSREEDSLLAYINIFQTDTQPSRIKYYDSLFIKKMAGLMKTKMSFYFPFTKLQDYLYLVYPDDSLFRIFTWQYSLNSMTVFQQGVVQLKTQAGDALFYPLLDRSQDIPNSIDTITTNTSWIGALYYDVLTNFDHKGHKIYTLLGLDENTILSNKKWIDILSFDENCKPIFGGDYFDFSKQKYAQDDPTILEKQQVRKQHKRFFIEYNKSFSVSLKYDDELNKILFDALVPYDEGLKTKKYSYQIDGEYQGFEWQNGKWHFIPKVFDYVLPNGEIPTATPLQFNPQGVPILKPVLKK